MKTAKKSQKKRKPKTPNPELYRQESSGEYVWDCKKAALRRLATVEVRFPFVKVVEAVRIPFVIEICSLIRINGLKFMRLPKSAKARLKFPYIFDVFHPVLGPFDFDHPYLNEQQKHQKFFDFLRRSCGYSCDPSEDLFRDWCHWATHDALFQHIQAAWVDTLHEGINLSDASGVIEFINRPELARFLSPRDCEHFEPTFATIRDYIFRGAKSDGDDPLSRCARINGDVVVGEVLLKEWAARALDATYASADAILRVPEREVGFYGSNIFHLCVGMRRKEFTRLIIKYLGHNGIYEKISDRLPKSPVDYGILRFVSPEIMCGPSVMESTKADNNTHPDVALRLRYPDSYPSECANIHKCHFCMPRMPARKRNITLMAMPSMADVRFVQNFDLYLINISQPEREKLKEIVINKPPDFFSYDQRVELIVEIGRARPRYGPETFQAETLGYGNFWPLLESGDIGFI